MSNQKFDDRLIRLVGKEALKERWRKKLRIKGVITGKKTTKKGSFLFTIKTTRLEYDVVVPKHRKKEFELAKDIQKGDTVRVTGERNIDIIFCDRIKKLKKSSLNEKQMRL